MDPAAILRELRDGPSAAARTGLFWLALGATVTVMVAVLLSPSVQGLAGIPEHLFGSPVARPRTATEKPLTPHQRAVARRAAVHMAMTQVGVHERGVNGGARIVRYRRAVLGAGENPHSREPWCADFVSWTWRRAGVPIGFDGRGSDYVPELVAWARLTRRWHWARDGYRPRAGDLVVFSSGGSRRGHIGLVASTHAGRIHTVEGNYGDRVARRTIKAWNPAITGFIAPV